MQIVACQPHHIRALQPQPAQVLDHEAVARRAERACQALTFAGLREGDVVCVGGVAGGELWSIMSPMVRFDLLQLVRFVREIVACQRVECVVVDGFAPGHRLLRLIDGFQRLGYEYDLFGRGCVRYVRG